MIVQPPKTDLVRLVEFIRRYAAEHSQWPNAYEAHQQLGLGPFELVALIERSRQLNRPIRIVSAGEDRLLTVDNCPTMQRKFSADLAEMTRRAIRPLP